MEHNEDCSTQEAEFPCCEHQMCSYDREAFETLRKQTKFAMDSFNILIDRNAKFEEENVRYREALELIAMPMRSDGTYNRDRKSCEELAREALKGE